jgi:hypothetical protein
MSGRALYYPEWTISDPQFLVEALLYWDRLAVMVPMQGYFHGVYHPDQEIKKIFNDLHEEFVTPIVPNDDQKERVHQRLSLLFEDMKAPDYLQPQLL